MSIIDYDALSDKLESLKGEQISLFQLDNYMESLGFDSSMDEADPSTGCIAWQSQKDFAKEKGYSHIEVESVLTDEMNNFCKKNGFQPEKYVIGNYILSINGGESIG